MRRILPGKVVSLGMKCSIESRTRIDICESIRHRTGDVLKQIGAGKKVLVVFQESIPRRWLDDTLESLMHEEFEASLHTLPEGESAKSETELMALWAKLQSLSFERNDTVLAVGGGATSDVAGFAASTYLRGIRFVLIPTTLLAQVDAAIGGKTAINLAAGKNLAGSIYMPDAILIDNEVLATLPTRDLRSGMGEIVKYAFIEKTIADQTEYTAGPGSLLAVLETSFASGVRVDDPAIPSIVTSCARMKLAVVAVDPREERLRRCLNLGHTLGHAIEKVSEYSTSHGEAVAIGTMFALQLACWQSRINLDQVQRARQILTAMELPTTLPPALSVDALMSAMLHDKKRADGEIKFVLPEKEAGYVDLDFSVKTEALKGYLCQFANTNE